MGHVIRRFEADRCISPMKTALLRDAVVRVLGITLLILPKIPGRQGVDAIARALDRADELTAGPVSTALARHPDPEALAVSLRGVDSKNIEVRQAALRGLGIRKDVAACPVLLGAISDPDEIRASTPSAAASS